MQVKVDHYAKYNSVAGGYWRDKIQAIRNEQEMKEEQPDNKSGIVQLDRQVEGDWLLVDHS